MALDRSQANSGPPPQHAGVPAPIVSRTGGGTGRTTPITGFQQLPRIGTQGVSQASTGLPSAAATPASAVNGASPRHRIYDSPVSQYPDYAGPPREGPMQNAAMHGHHPHHPPRHVDQLPQHPMHQGRSAGPQHHPHHPQQLQLHQRQLVHPSQGVPQMHPNAMQRRPGAPHSSSSINGHSQQPMLPPVMANGRGGTSSSHYGPVGGPPPSSNGILAPPGNAGPAESHNAAIRFVIEKGNILNAQAAQEQSSGGDRKPLPETLQKLDSETEDCHLKIGNIAWSMGDGEKAIRSFERALRRNPLSIPALQGMARYCKDVEEWHLTVDYAARALALDDDGHEGEMWSTVGHALLFLGQLHKAYSCYQQAIAKAVKKDNPNLWYDIGILYDRYGSMEHAEEAFASVLKMDRNFHKRDEVYFRLGIIYKLQGKADASLECFHYILADPPAPLKQVDVWYQIGHALELKRDLVAAKEAYERVLRTTPDHSRVLQHLSGIYLRENTQFHDPAECIKYITQSLEHDSQDPFSWYLLGRAYMQQNNYGKAYEAYQQAVYRDGKNSAYWCSIGVLYFNINQYHDALDAYTRAVRIHPWIPEIWSNLGTLYESCHDQLGDALDAYFRAHRLDPDNAMLQNRVEELRLAVDTGREVASAPPAPLDIMPDNGTSAVEASTDPDGLDSRGPNVLSPASVITTSAPLGALHPAHTRSDGQIDPLASAHLGGPEPLHAGSMMEDRRNFAERPVPLSLDPEGAARRLASVRNGDFTGTSPPLNHLSLHENRSPPVSPRSRVRMGTSDRKGYHMSASAREDFDPNRPRGLPMPLNNRQTSDHSPQRPMDAYSPPPAYPQRRENGHGMPTGQGPPPRRVVSPSQRMGMQHPGAPSRPHVPSSQHTYPGYHGREAGGPAPYPTGRYHPHDMPPEHFQRFDGHPLDPRERELYERDLHARRIAEEEHFRRREQEYNRREMQQANYGRHSQPEAYPDLPPGPHSSRIAGGPGQMSLPPMSTDARPGARLHQPTTLESAGQSARNAKRKIPGGVAQELDGRNSLGSAMRGQVRNGTAPGAPMRIPGSLADGGPEDYDDEDTAAALIGLAGLNSGAPTPAELAARSSLQKRPRDSVDDNPAKKLKTSDERKAVDSAVLVQV